MSRFRFDSRITFPTKGLRTKIRSFTCTVFVSVGSGNEMNNLSLVGMQLPEKYKENFDVSSEGPSSGVISNSRQGSSHESKFYLYFPGS